MILLRLPSPLRRTIFDHSTRPLLRYTSTLRTDGEYEPPHASNTAPPPSPPSPPSPPLPPSPPPPLLTLRPETLNTYAISHCPTLSDLTAARSFFTRTKPEILFSAAQFRTLPESPFPEVAFLGRSNVGKSSILNALFGRPKDKPAHVSKRPGKTRTMNGFGIGGEGLVGQKAAHVARTPTGEKQGKLDAAWKRYGRGGIVIVDMPGYGSGSRGEWGQEAMKYLENRKQLRRTYVLIDTEHGLKRTDVQLLLHLRRHAIPHQIVLSKVDKLLYPSSRRPSASRLHRALTKLAATRKSLYRTLDAAAAAEQQSPRKKNQSSLGDVLCCSAEKGLEERHRSQRIGIDELRWSVLAACGMENYDVRSPLRGNKNNTNGTQSLQLRSLSVDDDDNDDDGRR